MKKTFVIFFSVIICLHISAQTITTVAGNGTAGYLGDGGPATLSQLNSPYGICFDRNGNLYIADALNHRIRKINTSGIVTTIAGTGIAGYSGNGGPSTSAQLNRPTDVATDTLGNIYISDEFNFVIRKINTSGIISTYAGTSVSGYTGDGGVATSAQLTRPNRVSIDRVGNIYIALYQNNVIRKVSASGIISTIAGIGTAGYSGDGGLATAAELNEPGEVAVDYLGNIYIADEYNNRIRKINTSGIINTIAGNGIAGYSGDGAAATSAKINYMEAVSVDGLGNIYIPDKLNNVIRKVNTSGIISTIAGTGVAGYSGDGGLALSALLHSPQEITFDSIGNMYFTDGFNNAIRKITVPCTPPTINISGVTSLCSGNGTVLTAGGTATSYTWSANAGGVTTNTVSLAPTSTTTYTLNSNNGTCSGTNTVTVFVTTTPTLNISGTTNVCSGNNTVLTGSGATSYTWNTGSVSINTPTINVTPNSTVTFTLTGMNGNCSDSKSVTITVTPTPTLSVSGATNICSENGTILSGSGATTYTWSANAGSVTTASVSLNPLSTTTYTLTGANGNCIVFSTTTVSVTPTPTITISGPATICSGIQATLNGSGASTYTWSANAENATTNTVIVTPQITSTYTLTGANNSCNGEVVITVTVTPSPTINVNSQAICSGTTTTLTATGATSYTWNPLPQFSNSNSSIVIDVPNQTTTYSITGINSDGCLGNTTATVSVTPTPTISITGPGNICSGIQTILTGNGAGTYTWSANAGSVTTNTVGITPQISDSYTLSGSDVSGLCNSSTVVSVTVMPSPTVTVNSQTVCVGATATLTATGATSYTWSPQPQFSNANSSIVFDSQNQTTTYTITGLGSDGCFGNTTAILVIDSCFTNISQLTFSGTLIYPNPTSQYLNIEIIKTSDAAEYKIFNVIGNEVKTGTLTFSSNEIDLNDLAEGMYTIIVSQKEGTISSKISLQR